MKPAIATAFDYDIPFARMIPMIRQAGFEVVSLGGVAEHSGYPTAEGRARIRKLMEENGLEMDSVHSPIAGWPLFSLDEAKRRGAVRQCKMAIDAAFDLGVGIVVIHSPPMDLCRGEIFLEEQYIVKALPSSILFPEGQI